MLCEGLPLPPEIELILVGNSATLMVTRGMHGGAATLSGGKKKGAATLNGGKKKKRGKKKAAQRVANYRDAKHRSELLYEERTTMMEGGQHQEEMSFKEFKESMKHIETTHETRAKGYKAEWAYKKEIETYKVPLYDNLKPCKKVEDIMRLMSININYLSM